MLCLYNRTLDRLLNLQSSFFSFPFNFNDCSFVTKIEFPLTIKPTWFLFFSISFVQTVTIFRFFIFKKKKKVCWSIFKVRLYNLSKGRFIYWSHEIWMRPKNINSAASRRESGSSRTNRVSRNKAGPAGARDSRFRRGSMPKSRGVMGNRIYRGDGNIRGWKRKGVSTRVDLDGTRHKRGSGADLVDCRQRLQKSAKCATRSSV